MTSGSKITSVIFRICELFCAAIVVGILGRYLYLLDIANAGHSDRIVYGISVGSIALLFSIILMIPARYSFLAFPFDIIMFIMWMVAFGLMEDLTGSDACDSYWYWNSWGYYWGRWWYTVPLSRATPALIGTSYCGEWRANLAFSFIGGWFWLMSGALGAYVCSKGRREPAYREQEANGATNGAHQNGTKPEVTMTPSTV